MPEGNSIHTSHHKDALKIGTHLSVKHKTSRRRHKIKPLRPWIKQRFLYIHHQNTNVNERTDNLASPLEVLFFRISFQAVRGQATTW